VYYSTAAGAIGGVGTVDGSSRTRPTTRRCPSGGSPSARATMAPR